MTRQRVLLAYDVGQPRQQRQVRERIREQASGYQLSAYECYFNRIERDQLLAQLEHLITENACLIACPIDSTRPSHYLGVASPPLDDLCSIID